MRVLRVGMEGEDVRAWEWFLRGRDLYEEEADGRFDEGLEAATRTFQVKSKLSPDGAVGRMTLAAAIRVGFDPTVDDDEGRDGPNWPPRPDGLSPLVGNDARAAAFGAFRYKAAPAPGNPEAIVILDGWQANNIVKVPVPQLAGLMGAGSSTGFFFHKLAAKQVQALFLAWEKAGLKDRLRSWAGSWVPRFIRGSRTVLSNHAWGTAFDVNVAWNQLGTVPALAGRPGSVRELVPIANSLGFWWGGHFSDGVGGLHSRVDGMHFEVARVLDDAAIAEVLRSL